MPVTLQNGIIRSSSRHSQLLLKNKIFEKLLIPAFEQFYKNGIYRFPKISSLAIDKFLPFQLFNFSNAICYYTIIRYNEKIQFWNFGMIRALNFTLRQSKKFNN